MKKHTVFFDVIKYFGLIASFMWENFLLVLGKALFRSMKLPSYCDSFGQFYVFKLIHFKELLLLLLVLPTQWGFLKVLTRGVLGATTPIFWA